MSPEIDNNCSEKRFGLLIQTTGKIACPPRPDCEALQDDCDILLVEALGQTIAEGCHRPELTAALLGQDLTHRITEEDIVKICLDVRGLRKGVGERPFWIVLNKADDGKIRRRGEEIRKRVMERRPGQWVGVTSLKHV